MNKKIIILIIGLVVLIFLIFTFKSKNDLPKNLGEWQAVFLSDGQVYFGHLEKNNNRFFTLSRVYYLKYSSLLQQNNNSDAQSSQNLNLIKLGGEVDGPENSMYIDKSQIIFIENLKESSAVVQAMKKSI